MSVREIPETGSIAPVGSGWGMTAVGIGCALITIGTPLAWVIRASIGSGTSPIFTALLQVAGILLVPNYNAIRRGTLLARKAEVAPVLIPLLCIAVMTMAAVGGALDGTSRGVMGMDRRQLIDTVMMIVFACAMFSQPLSKFDRLPLVLTVVGVFTAAMTIGFALSSLENFAEFMAMGRLGGVGDDAQGSSPYTVSKVGAVTILAAVIWYRQGRHPSLVRMLFVAGSVVIGVLTIMFAQSRTMSLGLILVGTLTFAFSALRQRLFPKQKKRYIPRLSRRNLVIGAALFFALVFGIVYYGDYLSVLSDKSFGGLISGAGTYAGGGAVDASALARRESFHRTIDYFYIWGQGFEAIFADDPVLTSFYDLGLFGGAAFVFITLLLPLRICFDICARSWLLPPAVQFALAFYVMSCPNLFLVVMPYSSPNWYPIIIFYAIVGRYWNSRKYCGLATGENPRAIDLR